MKIRAYLFLIVSIGGFLAAITPQVAAFGNGSDTFDDDIIGLCPEAPDNFYIATNCGTGSRIVNNCPGGREGLCFDSSIATTGAGSEGAFDFGSGCESAPSFTVSFDFYMAGLPASGNTYNLNVRYFTTGTNDGAVGIRISGAGDYWAAVYESGSPTTLTQSGNVLSGLVAATWYSATIAVTGDLCAASVGDPAVLSIQIDSGQTSNTLVTSFGTGTAAIRYQPRRTIATANQAITVDNFSVTGLSVPITSAATSAAFPTGYTLTGFDLDYMQRGPIARLQHTVDNVQKIYAFDPISLGVRGLTPLDNDCTPVRSDGVMSTWQDPPGLSYTGFIDCVVDPTEVDTVRIRDGALEEPSHVGTLCDPAVSGDNDFCSVDLTSQSAENCWNNGEINTDARIIAQVQAIPISWRAFHNEPDSVDSVDIGFAYSTAATVSGTGVVGVWVTSQHNDVADTSCFDEIPYGGAGNDAAHQICSWHNTLDGNDYITAVSVVNPTVTWRVDFSSVRNVGLIHTNLNTRAQMSQVGQLPPGMVGVACNDFSNSTILMHDDGTVARYRTVGPNIGTKVWAEDITDGVTTGVRGVTMSRNGAWGAYLRNDGTWAVINATDGSVLGTGTIPTGNFVDMKLSGNGQDLFIATSTQIQRFHVAPATTGDDLPDNCLPGSGGEACPDTFQSNGTLGVSPAPDIGNNFGAGCSQTWDGEIIIGVTYVPLGTWTNCASMAFETMLTVMFLVAATGFAQFKVKGEVDGRLLFFAGILGAFASIFLWQFPIWPFVVGTVAWLVLALVARKSSGGAQA